MIKRQSRLWMSALGVPVAFALSPFPLASQDTPTFFPDPLSVQRVSCPGDWCKALAGLLLGPVASENSVPLVLANWGLDPLTITNIHMVATGETSEAFLEGTGDSLDVEGMTAKLVHLRLPSLVSIRADRYVGEIRVRTEGVDDTASISFDLDVRDGPWLVILALLMGLLAGRLAVKINQSGGTDELSGWWNFLLFPWAAGFLWKKGPAGEKNGSAGWPAFIGSTLTGVAWTVDSSKKHQFRVRAGISATLLVVVIYEGLKLLYLNDATFGDNGILDYAAVFAWAVATDGGQRFVTNLGWDPG